MGAWRACRRSNAAIDDIIALRLPAVLPGEIQRLGDNRRANEPPHRTARRIVHQPHTAGRARNQACGLAQHLLPDAAGELGRASVE
jgi:hypothetical protein